LFEPLNHRAKVVLGDLSLDPIFSSDRRRSAALTVEFEIFSKPIPLEWSEPRLMLYLVE
jgi:hypothetical protein